MKSSRCWRRADPRPARPTAHDRACRRLAATVLPKRATPFSPNQPVEFQLSVEGKVDDLVPVDHGLQRPAPPFAPTVILKSEPVPERTGPVVPHKKGRPWALIVSGLGMLAVLATVGVGYSLISRGGGKPAASLGTPSLRGPLVG